MEFDKYDLSELKRIQKAIGKAILVREAEEQNRAIRELRKLAKDHGFTLEELIPDGSVPSGGNTAKRTGRYRYAHPEDRTLTWSGMGKRPKWFNDCIAAGMSREQLIAS